MTARRVGGFTLLEVVVALAILAMALMAIFNLNAGAIAMHAYTKKLTVATLLARSKMTDVEQKLFDKGFNADDEDDGGDFSEEGWPSFKWRVKILAPKTDGISPEQVIAAVFNIPLGTGMDTTGGGGLLSGLSGGSGGLGSSGGGGDLMSSLGSLLGGSGLSGLLGGGADGGSGAGGAGGLLSMLGPLASTQFQQMVDQITKTVREVHLTVSWKEGKQVESIDLVTHIVSTGPGGDRNGTVMAGQSAASIPGANAATQGPMVDAITGQPCTNPQPGPNGSFINPANGNQCVPSGSGANPAAGAAAGLNSLMGNPQQPPSLNPRGMPGLFPGLGNPPFVPRPVGH